MPTPEDRSFFESLNKDLANSLERSIASAFKASASPNAGISLSQGTIDAIGAAVGSKVGGKPGDKPPLDTSEAPPDKKGGAVGAGKVQAMLGKLNQLIGSMMALVGQNVNNVFAFGDKIARSAAATNQELLKQTRQQGKDGKFLTDEFGKFGFNMRQVGGMLDTTMRMNVRGINVNTQKFIARTQGFGVSMDSVGKFLSIQTEVLGKDIDETTVLGQGMMDLSRATGVLGDAIFDAVNAFTDQARSLEMIHSPEVAAKFTKAIAGLGTEFPQISGDIEKALTSLSDTTAAGMMTRQQLGASIGVDLGMDRLNNDTEGWIIDAIRGLASANREARGTPGMTDPIQAAVFSEERIQKLSGLKLPALHAMSQLDKLDPATLRARVSGQLKPGELDRATDTKKKQEFITGISEEAAMNLKNWSIETAAAATQFAAVDKAAKIFRETLYSLEDGFMTLAGNMAGKATAWTGIMGKVMGVVSPLADIATLAFLARRGRVGGGGGGTGPGVFARGKGATVAAARWLMPAAAVGGAANLASKGIGLGVNPHTGLPHNVAQPLATVGRGARFAGAGKAALFGKGAARLPGIGAVISGGLEYMETGDKSRAAMTGAGAGLGAWGMAGAGVAAGALFGPAAVIMSPLLGILGGLVGAFGGGKVGQAANDWLDDDYVEQKRVKDNKAFGAATAEDASQIQVEQGALLVQATRQTNNEIRLLSETIRLQIGAPMRRGVELDEAAAAIRVEQLAHLDDASVAQGNAVLHLRKLGSNSGGVVEEGSATFNYASALLNQGASV